jgi:hypothetical protein
MPKSSSKSFKNSKSQRWWRVLRFGRLSPITEVPFLWSSLGLCLAAGPGLSLYLWEL